MGNQGILNYLLIVLRRDKDLGKFWKIVNSMVNQPKLEEAIKQVQKGIHICNAECNIYFLKISTTKVLQSCIAMYKQGSRFHQQTKYSHMQNT